jgi:hypothetical protein
MGERAIFAEYQHGKLNYITDSHYICLTGVLVYQGRICTLTNKNIIFTAKSIQNVPSTVVLSGN